MGTAGRAKWVSFRILAITWCLAGLSEPVRAAVPPMVVIPAGRFLAGQNPRALPRHEVTLTRSFAIGRFEVTNAEYVDALNWAWEHGRVRMVGDTVKSIDSEAPLLVANGIFIEVGFDGSRFCVRRSLAPWSAAALRVYGPERHPVFCVSWFAAAAYCNWLSEREDLDPLYIETDGWSCRDVGPYAANCYRLPTEAEWEWSARGPKGWEMPFNRARSSVRSGYWPDPAANFGGGWTGPVGEFSPMGDSFFHVADLTGNVWEWVFDRWSVYKTNACVDPVGGGTSSDRMLRGGAYNSTIANFCDAATRAYDPPEFMSRFVGFRIARTTTPDWRPDAVEIPPMQEPKFKVRELP